MRLYNTLGRKLEEFKPTKKGRVGIYSCGPTVYWNQHIGHMYAYVQWDTLVRFLRFLGFEVKWVMNITDVGHMTSDEDLGEDKMEKGAKREGISVWDVAERYIQQFKESLEVLNVSVDEMPRATEHIEEQIALIEKMEKRGFVYRTKTGMVFDTRKFAEYGDFARLDLDRQLAGLRIGVDPEKKAPWDFMLWITNQPKHIMQWDSPWGRGFPGWHIECTAMSVKYLGEKFDIHTGGKEHISVHHTNEIAQGYGAFGDTTANYWLHNAHLLIDKKKMSKSLGNMVLVQDLVGKGKDPLALRYLILNSHYRKGMNFTWEALEGAQIALENIRREILKLQGDGKQKGKVESGKAKNFRVRFAEALENDLNAPQALAVFWEVVKSGLEASERLDLLLDFDQVFGLNLSSLKVRRHIVESKVEALFEKREELREEKEWDMADKIRKKIEEMGYLIEDTDEGSRLVKID